MNRNFLAEYKFESNLFLCRSEKITLYGNEIFMINTSYNYVIILSYDEKITKS
jgi:hypothetical protein